VHYHLRHTPSPNFFILICSIITSETWHLGKVCHEPRKQQIFPLFCICMKNCYYEVIQKGPFHFSFKLYLTSSLNLQKITCNMIERPCQNNYKQLAYIQNNCIKYFSRKYYPPICTDPFKNYLLSEINKSCPLLQMRFTFPTIVQVAEI
jgi:hypothetical protein